MKTIKMFFLLSALLISIASWGQRTITGIVLDDETGEPLIGASVVVKGTTYGVQTDFDGKYSIKAKEGDILIVSYLGFVTQEKKVGKSSTSNFRLAKDTQELDEVVVVAYGKTRKEDLTTSVSTIKIDDNLKSRPANIESMLQGQLSGVTIQSGGGDPLSGGSTISIRGRGSRGVDGDPSSGDGVLFIVDGVPGAPYNVEDVESITVLKDAASAAMYGAYVGSGGVVVVTTKKAKEGVLNVDINSSVGISKAWNLPDVITADQFMKVKKDALAQYPASPNTAKFVTISEQPYFGVTRTNWLDEIFRSAVVTHQAVSISGGSQKISALGSFSYDKKEGTLINTFSESIGAKTNVGFHPTKWLTIRENATYKYSNGQGGLNNYNHQGVIMNAIFFPRSSTIYDYSQSGEQLHDENGNALYQGTVPRFLVEKGVTGFGEVRNPVATLKRLKEYRPSHNIYSTTTLEVKPIESIVFKSDFTVGVSSNRYEGFNPKVPEIGLRKTSNERDLSSSLYKNWIWETTGSYSKRINSHTFDFMLGYNLSAENSRYFSVQVRDFSKEDDFYTILPNGNDWKSQKPYEDIWDESAISTFSRLGYSFADRYFLTASVRRDATSKLYKDNNSGIFPAISGSWKISSEDFFAPAKKTFNLVKLRGSWGQVGNKSLVPRYSYNVAMGMSDWETYYGLNLDNYTKGVFQKTIANRDLTWETTEQLGFGLDLGLFNQIEITADWYKKTTKDLIEKMPISPTAGVEVEPYGNIGQVLNQGFEVGVNYHRKIGEVDLSVFGNLNTVKNEVQDLGGREFMEHRISQQDVLRSTVGQPWYSYYVLKTDGIFQNASEIDNYTFTDANGATNKIQPNAQPGDLKYVDTNNDGVINDKDRQYMGSYLPEITYAFGSGINYKGIDFSFFFQGISEVMVYNQFKAFGLTGRGDNYMLSDVMDSWEYNKNSGIPRMGFVNDDNGNYSNYSDFLLEDGSYLRLKNITLGYTLPAYLMENWKMKNAKLRLYINAENVLTFTKYSGLDPEVGNFGVDVGNYPTSRTVSLGVNFSF